MNEEVISQIDNEYGSIGNENSGRKELKIVEGGRNESVEAVVGKIKSVVCKGKLIIQKSIILILLRTPAICEQNFQCLKLECLSPLAICDGPRDSQPHPALLLMFIRIFFLMRAGINYSVYKDKLAHSSGKKILAFIFCSGDNYGFNQTYDSHLSPWKPRSSKNCDDNHATKSLISPHKQTKLRAYFVFSLDGGNHNGLSGIRRYSALNPSWKATNYHEIDMRHLRYSSCTRGCWKSVLLHSKLAMHHALVFQKSSSHNNLSHEVLFTHQKNAERIGFLYPKGQKFSTVMHRYEHDGKRLNKRTEDNIKHFKDERMQMQQRMCTTDKISVSKHQRQIQAELVEKATRFVTLQKDVDYQGKTLQRIVR